MIFSKDLPIDAKYPKSCLYWIHLGDEHTDPRTQGYVGVSSYGAEARFKQHILSAKKNSTLIVHNAMRKYADRIKVVELIIADPEFCLLAEGMLRPEVRMTGTWNFAPGGGVSPMLGLTGEDHPCFGKPCSDTTRSKISEANSGSKNGMSKMVGELNHFFGKRHKPEAIEKMRQQVQTAEQREINRQRLLNNEVWESPRAIKTMWANAVRMYEMFLDGGTQTQIAVVENITYSRAATMYKKFRSGWNPTVDQGFQIWLDNFKRTANESPLTA